MLRTSLPQIVTDTLPGPKAKALIDRRAQAVPSAIRCVYPVAIARGEGAMIEDLHYFSVIYRGGIQGVPVGQREAAQVLGFTRRQIFFKITLLQMIKRIVPPMSNEIITLVKDTSLARIIAVTELIKAGESFMKSSGIIWPLFYTGVFYLIFVGILTILFNFIERKLSYFR